MALSAEESINPVPAVKLTSHRSWECRGTTGTATLLYFQLLLGNIVIRQIVNGYPAVLLSCTTLCTMTQLEEIAVIRLTKINWFKSSTFRAQHHITEWGDWVRLWAKLVKDNLRPSVTPTPKVFYITMNQSSLALLHSHSSCSYFIIPM